MLPAWSMRYWTFSHIYFFGWYLVLKCSFHCQMDPRARQQSITKKTCSQLIKHSINWTCEPMSETFSWYLIQYSVINVELRKLNVIVISLTPPPPPSLGGYSTYLWLRVSVPLEIRSNAFILYNTMFSCIFRHRSRLDAETSYPNQTC